MDILEHSPISAHRFGDKEVGTVAGVIERRRMELDEFHILDCSLGAIDHGDAIACGYQRIGSCAINCTDATCSHHRDTSQEGVDHAGLFVKDISAIAGDVGCATSHDASQVVRSDDFYGKVSFENIDILVGSHPGDEALLDFGAGVVGMVEDTKFGVSPLAMEVECAILFLVEIDTPRHELAYLFRGILHHLLDCGRVGEPVSRHHRVVDMLVEVIDQQVGN